MPIPILFGTFAALLFLTWLTVFIADYGHLGKFDIYVALGIATVKATLVGLYFMHLRYDKPFNILLFLFCFFFVGLFLGAALLDSLQYEPQIEQFEAQKTINS